MRRNQDGRIKKKKIDSEMLNVNLFIFYHIDGEEAKTVLRLDDYDGDDEGSWVLLEGVEG